MTSPVIDFYGIGTALAARFVAATIGTPSGAPAMRASWPMPPKNVAAVPCVVVEFDEGEVVASPGQWQHQATIDVWFLLSKRPGDPARVDADRRRWLPYLLHATVDKMQLGIGAQVGYTVDKAFPLTWSFTEYTVGGDEYDAIHVPYRVWVTETVTLTP